MLVRPHILREASPNARGRFVSPLRGSLVCGGCTHAVRRQAHLNWVYFSLRGRKCDADLEVCWSGPTSFAHLSRMPMEVLRCRFAAPLGCSFCFIDYGPIYDVIRLHPIKQVRIPCVSRFFIYFFYRKKMRRIILRTDKNSSRESCCWNGVR